MLRMRLSIVSRRMLNRAVMAACGRSEARVRDDGQELVGEGRDAAAGARRGQARAALPGFPSPAASRCSAVREC